jgi:hypothetical protein
MDCQHQSGSEAQFKLIYCCCFVFVFGVNDRVRRTVTTAKAILTYFILYFTIETRQ